MSALQATRPPLLKAALGALFFLAFQGCTRYTPVPAKAGPNNEVTVEIIGVMNDSIHNKIRETLWNMVDTPHSSFAMAYNQIGNNTTVKLAPVSDVQAFAKKIDFGKVIEVKDRTVKVEVK